jgi:hypothetical protein
MQTTVEILCGVLVWEWIERLKPNTEQVLVPIVSLS